MNQNKRMKPSMVSSSEWAWLPKHLLDMVLEKLNLFPDYVRFSAVCVPWYCVAMENRKQFAKKIDRQLPMLLFPKKDEEKGEVKILYDSCTNKLVNVEIRVSFSTRYGGSSKGWLITMGEDFVVKLINPISPKGAVITLPPISKNEMDYSIQIRKGILSADPTIEPKDYTVVVIYGSQGQLAFIKPGRQDVCWTFIDKIKTVFDDIIYHEGRLHAVDFASNVFSFDEYIIKSSSVPSKLPPIPKHLYTRGEAKNYLIESLGGDLLLIRRLISFSHYGGIESNETRFRNTVEFKVFKWNPSGPDWVKMETLGEESLFLGDNMSTSILASDFPGCFRNSIYFTHDFDDIYCVTYGNNGPKDSGVFNLENSHFSPHYTTDQASLFAMSKQPPIWFVPNFLSKEPFPYETMVAKVENEFIR